MRLLNKLKALLGGQTPLPTIEASSLKIEDVGKMLRLLDAMPLVEVTCDEVNEVLDEFTEAAVRGENVAELMPLIHQHVQKCSNCQAKYLALKRILQAMPVA
ncbi:MAG: hypothetical protein KIH69_023850 [Anaerolineae bacterium]|nr:hypothetical protein [Anaerolineae bacterium]